MSKTMGVSPITDTIYYGTVKNNMWQDKKEDVTDMAIKAVFEWFMHKLDNECPDGAYQIRFPNVPYVLEMRKEESVDDKHCEKMNQGGVAADVLEENRTNIPANDNSEATEAYKINWSEMKCASYEELLSFLISNEGNEDLIGKIRVGDICIDVINHPEVEKIFFDFYVLSEDTGYGFSKGIPYSYADDFSISYNDIYVAMKQNQSMMENIEKEIENHIKTFALNQYSLIEHAKRELVIW